MTRLYRLGMVGCAGRIVVVQYTWSSQRFAVQDTCLYVRMKTRAPLLERSDFIDSEPLVAVAE